MAEPTNPIDPGQRRLTRRGFIATAGSLMAAASAVPTVRAATNALAGTQGAEPPVPPALRSLTEPFWGPHQAGILTPQQNHTYFAAFDLSTNNREDVIGLLRVWTAAAAALANGQTAQPLGQDVSLPGADTGEALGLTPARLTITFGFGAGLFIKDGKDRFGLASQRPEALVDLPGFKGDQLVKERTGGDLSVQACADDPQVAFHAVRQLARLAANAASLRWVQAGYYSKFAPKAFPYERPRNLLGFKEGTSNVAPNDDKELGQSVWVGSAGPNWMQGGSYQVVRRIHMALERWDRLSVADQEQIFGRHKYSGAPLGEKSEMDVPDLGATNKDGQLLIPDHSHVRLAIASSNEGVRILRRPYTFNEGLTGRGQEREYDAGQLFICYQLDPRTGFIKIFEKMAQHDKLNQFVTPTGGGLFACPRGVAEGEFIGQGLFAKF